MILFYMGIILVFASCGGRTETNLGAGRTFHLGKGSPQLFRLPDSTTLLMSPETSVNIRKEYGLEKREIDLDGEAMIEVPPSGKPFVVHTRDLDIEVLGTKFHVDAYRNKPGEEVDLLEGRLRAKKAYRSDTDSVPEVLEAGEMVMINRDIDLMEKEKLSPAELEKLKAKQ